MRLKNEAIFEWNARSSIRDKSFEFVNSVLKKLTDANEKIIGDACNHDISFLREIINNKGRYIICAIDSNDERKLVHNFIDHLVCIPNILREFAMDRIGHELVMNVISGNIRTKDKTKAEDGGEL